MTTTIHRHQIINMLMQSFAQSERIQNMLRSRRPIHLRAFFEYIYTHVKRCGRIFLSTDQSTLLLFYQQSNQGQNWELIKAKLNLLLNHFSLVRLRETLATIKTVNAIRIAHAIRHGDNDYLYVWFLAGKEKRQNYAGLYEAMEYLKVESKMNNLPIYIETAVHRMLPIYLRAGFKCYTETESNGQHIWFLKFGNYEK